MSASNCGKESSTSHTSPKGSCMTIAAEFSVTSERSSAYHRNVGNNRKTVNFPWLVNPFSHTEPTLGKCTYLLVSNKNEYLLSANHRQALTEKFTFILLFDA